MTHRIEVVEWSYSRDDTGEPATLKLAVKGQRATIDVYLLVERKSIVELTTAIDCVEDVDKKMDNVLTDKKQ